MNDLEAIITVRNRFAHRSEFSQIQFNRLVRNEIGFNPPGMTPGRFLLTAIANIRVGKKTYFDFFTDLMLSLAYIIVP